MISDLRCFIYPEKRIYYTYISVITFNIERQ